MTNKPGINGRALNTKVVVIQPDERVPLGRFEQWLKQAGVEITLIRPFAGDAIPREIAADGLVVLGGTMHTDSLAEFPWLTDIMALYRTAVEANIPTLGICLGAQLLAVAFDGEVTSHSSRGPEIGVVDIDWTQEAINDPLVGGLSASLQAISFHYDGITTLPSNAVLLGGSQHYPNQVFRLGEAVGVQFHPEATPELFSAWCVSDLAAKPDLAGHFDQQIREVQAADEQIAAQAAVLVGNFVQALHSVPLSQRG